MSKASDKTYNISSNRMTDISEELLLKMAAKKSKNKKSVVSVSHIFLPVCNEQSKILILGSMPSVKSRENGFYYGHPQNRFWKVLAHVLGTELPQTIEEKKNMLLENHIALWDVIESCDIVGSSDSSIRNVYVNDIAGVIRNTDIKTIFTNGSKAHELYNKYVIESTGIEAVKLPSTSPANAACNFEKLCEAWKKVADMLGKVVERNG